MLLPCGIFLNLFFFPSWSRSSCCVFSFQSHIWNLLWLLFELIACSSVCWVAETSTSVITVMAIWCIVVMIWFQTAWNFSEYLWIFPYILLCRLCETKCSLTLPRASWTVPYLTAYFPNGCFNIIIRVCY